MPKTATKQRTTKRNGAGRPPEKERFIRRQQRDFDAELKRLAQRRREAQKQLERIRADERRVKLVRKALG